MDRIASCALVQGERPENTVNEKRVLIASHHPNNAISPCSRLGGRVEAGRGRAEAHCQSIEARRRGGEGEAKQAEGTDGISLHGRGRRAYVNSARQNVGLRGSKGNDQGFDAPRAMEVGLMHQIVSFHSTRPIYSEPGSTCLSSCSAMPVNSNESTSRNNRIREKQPPLTSRATFDGLPRLYRNAHNAEPSSKSNTIYRIGACRVYLGPFKGSPGVNGHGLDRSEKSRLRRLASRSSVSGVVTLSREKGRTDEVNVS